MTCYFGICHIYSDRTGARPAGANESDTTTQANKGGTMRLIKLLAVVILAVLIGLVGYAYFGDMEPVRSEIRSPLQLGAPGD